MKPNKPKPKYKWPTLSDRLNSKPVSRAEASRQLKEAAPLSESAQRELDTTVERSLVEITRVYASGPSVSLADECAALQSELQALSSGPIRISIEKIDSHPVKQSTGEGGNIEMNYMLKDRECILKD